MRLFPLTAAAYALIVLWPHVVSAQLISPGKLSQAHASVEGIRQCTQCHELGQRGTSNQKCLGCHKLLEARVAKGRGYHAAVRGDQCAECHRDHLGRAVSPLRFDTSAFRHESTGYRLKGAHAEQSCRECHRAAYVTARDVRSHGPGAGFMETTFLGLSTGCVSCHNTDSPHGAQLRNRGCHDCHSESDWKRVDGFDHGSTRYPLTGAHESVKCAGCHTEVNDTVRYRGIRFASCGDCHRDPHRGEVAGACTNCHTTTDWQRVDRRAVASTFNHSRTRFALEGAHARVACASCHSPSRSKGIHLTFGGDTRGSTYARPAAQTCASCHTDPHPRSYQASRAPETCSGCHTVNAWSPVRYDLTRHNRAGNFALDGAHIAVACNACHVSRAAPARACVACHRQDDPHRGAFGTRACADCHKTTDFRDATLDHSIVANSQCVSCHQKDDPHRGQFGSRGCADCHETGSYRVRNFNHSRTAYPLDTAHARVTCGGCHKRAAVPGAASYTRYKPLLKACKDCHGGSS